MHPGMLQLLKLFFITVVVSVHCAGTAQKTQGSHGDLTSWSVRSAHFETCFLATLYFSQTKYSVSRGSHVRRVVVCV